MNVSLITNDYNNIQESKGFVNCSKCIRTIIGKLGIYSDIFDIYYYEHNKAELFANVYCLYLRSRDVFAGEVLKEIKNKKFKLPPKILICLSKRLISPLITRLKL